MTNPLAHNHMMFSKLFSPKTIAERFKDVHGHYPEYIFYPLTCLPYIDIVGVLVGEDEHAKLYAYAGPVKKGD